MKLLSSSCHALAKRNYLVLLLDSCALTKMCTCKKAAKTTGCGGFNGYDVNITLDIIDCREFFEPSFHYFYSLEKVINSKHIVLGWQKVLLFLITDWAKELLDPELL